MRSFASFQGTLRERSRSHLRGGSRISIALERGYHGSSSTGAGLTALANFHRNFDLPLRWQHHISSPYPYRSDLEGDDAAIIARSVQQLKDNLYAVKNTVFSQEELEAIDRLAAPVMM